MNEVVDDGGDRRRNHFLKTRLVCLCLVVVPLLVVYAMKQSQLSELDSKHEGIESKLTALKTKMQDVRQTKTHLKDAGDEAKLHGERLRQIVAYCDDPNDFWRNESVMCVSTIEHRRHMSDIIRLLLPKGDHLLQFRMEKQNLESDSQATVTELDFPIPGPAAYQIALEMPREKGAAYRDPRALTLRITSSNSRFAPLEKMLLDEAVPPPSGSSSGFFVNKIPTFYPNQYDPNQKGEYGTLLNRMSWSFIPQDKLRFKLIFEFRLKSDGTKVVPANDWWRVRNASNLKGLKYMGRGRYEVLP
jgi:hypothetical protein